MKRRRQTIKAFHTGQAGQALIMVMVLLVLGTLILVPALGLSMTALKTGEEYEAKSAELYTADAGIEDGVWRIKYDFFGPDYDEFDYDTVWSYETETVNGLTSNVTIENVWVPYGVDLATFGLSTEDARDIIESGRLVVTGTAGAVPGEPYNIKIDYTPAASENLSVTSIGVWLPQGFDYDDNSGTIENYSIMENYHADDYEVACDGGSAVVWYFSYPYPLFTDFPDVDTSAATMSTEIEFDYTVTGDDPDAMPAAIAWITTQLDTGAASDYPVSWDMDTKIFRISSTVGDTTIEAYASKCELRQMGDAMTGEYVAIGNSLMLDNYYPYDQRDTLLTESSTEITTIPDDADVIEAHLYWTAWRETASIIDVMDDDGSDIDTYWSYSSPSGWAQGSGKYLGHDIGGDSSSRYLTLDPALDLSDYVPGSIYLEWDYGTPGFYEESCNSLADWTAGSAWDTAYGRFRGNNNPGGTEARLTLTDPLDLSSSSNGTLTLSFQTWEDNNSDSPTQGLDYALSSDNGTTWSENVEVFRGNKNFATNYSFSINSTYFTDEFKLRFELIEFGSNKSCYIDNIEISGDALGVADGLDFAVSGDGGLTWSEYTEVFRSDQGSSEETYEYYLPAAYTTGNFKIRFKLVGTDGPGQCVSLDDILVRNLPPDNEVYFQIDGEQVYFDGDGEPASGSGNLTATDVSVMLSSWGYSYSCHLDVSSLVKTYPVNASEEYHTGNYEYTVGDVQGDISATEWNYLAHAGWSLIVIYASPSTAGHYLYLRDFFAHNPGNTNLDFDFDGEPGGDITNFVIPEPIRNKDGSLKEEVAARITCFIGEGDQNYSGDTLEITGQQSESSMYLTYDGGTWNNLWNGASVDMSYPGVDVDTFEIRWDDNILLPGDTSLHLDMDSGTDAWNFIYLILSVRSETLTSGTTHYLINRH